MGRLKWAVWYRVGNGAKGIKQQRPVTYPEIHKPLLWNLSFNDSKEYWMTGAEGCSMGTGTKGRGYIFFFPWGLILARCTGWASESFLSLVYSSMKTVGAQLRSTKTVVL